MSHGSDANRSMIVVTDASAAVKLVMHEDDSALVRHLWDDPVTWMAPSIVLPEVSSAIAAAHRGGRLGSSAAGQVHRQWEIVSDELDLVDVDVDLAGRARALAIDRAIRGMDAVYLAIAVSLPDHPVTLLSFDARQRAAMRDGDGVILIPDRD